ncbi:hypothetical protein FACS1894208_05150 [Clostridia bacterium]|nr:hypothetical protein FACS1894208_05150 [Clostridia bacterium]
MIKAIGILGSASAASKLRSSLRNKGVTLETLTYLDEIPRRLAESPDISAVLLVERAIGEITDTLAALREYDPTVRIILIHDAPERDYDFELWCHERHIYDVIYLGRQSEVNVVSCSRGFGATTLTVNLARCLSEANISVAVLAMDNSADLQFAKLERLGVTVSVPSSDQLPDWEGLREHHQSVIMDFGAVFDILPNGSSRFANPSHIVSQALGACDLIVVLSSDEPWHALKVKPFENYPKALVIDRKHADARNILSEIGVIIA